MKTLILIRSFLRGRILPILIVMLSTSLSLMILISYCGQYRYMAYQQEVFESSGLEDSVYVSYHDIMGSMMDYTEWRSSIQNELETHAAFERIIRYHFQLLYIEDIGLSNIRYFDDDMLTAFPLSVAKGRWLQADTDRVEMVVGGRMWPQSCVGKSTRLPNGIEATIVGHLGAYMSTPGLTNSSNMLNVGDLFTKADNFVILNCDALSEETKANVPMMESNYFFVDMRDDATEEQKEELLHFLESYAICTDYETIIENSNRDMQNWIRTQLPFPCFMLVISTICMICVSMVMIRSGFNEQAKYMLVGCSKQRSVGLMVQAFLGIFGIPAVLSVLFAVWYPSIMVAFGSSHSVLMYLFDPQAILPAVGYLLTVLLLLILMPMAYYWRITPITLYRKELHS